MTPVAAPPRSPAAQQRRAAPPPVAAIPFTAAAHEHREQVTTVTVTPGAASAAAGPFDVPAYGYLNSIAIEVTGAGGALGGGALSADYPFNIFQSLSLLDVNGAPIFGPLDGFAAMLANTWGAYSFRQDPRLNPDYVGTINTKFIVRIPIQIARHSGLGSLANQNAAASYKLQFTTNPLATIIVGGAPTAPTLTIKAWLEAWSLPNAMDLAGRPQATVPPQHGTTQYWSAFQRATVAGAQTYMLPRVGNLIRGLVFVCRDGTGARVDTVMPDPIQITWDARILTYESQNVRREVASNMLVPTATRDAGVFPFMFNNLYGGRCGDEEPNLWLPTVQSTRLELDGVSAVTGTIQTITNDVAPVEVIPEQRYVETSASGFSPQIGIANPSAQ